MTFQLTEDFQTLAEDSTKDTFSVRRFDHEIGLVSHYQGEDPFDYIEMTLGAHDCERLALALQECARQLRVRPIQVGDTVWTTEDDPESDWATPRTVIGIDGPAAWVTGGTLGMVKHLSELTRAD